MPYCGIILRGANEASIEPSITMRIPAITDVVLRTVTPDGRSPMTSFTVLSLLGRARISWLKRLYGGRSCPTAYDIPEPNGWRQLKTSLLLESV